jgi:uncharacterized membrane protein YfcA
LDVFYYAGLALTGFGAGLFGALLGLGGGVFVVPALVLIFRIPDLVAIGTSNIAVIATSTAGASTYVRNRLANLRLALVLLVSTTIAALLSSLVAALLPVQILRFLFAGVLLYTSYTMFRGRAPAKKSPAVPGSGGEVTGGLVKEAGTPGGDLADRLGLESAYHDAATGRSEGYKPQRIRTGITISALAGVIAGLLGLGGGIVQVPVMSLLMDVPQKVATGTSNFMIGVTATSAAFVRYAHGDINPLIAVPIALCVFLGARVGAWLVPRTPNARLKQIFAWVGIVIAALMVLQAFGIFEPPKK